MANILETMQHRAIVTVECQ